MAFGLSMRPRRPSAAFRSWGLHRPLTILLIGAWALLPVNDCAADDALVSVLVQKSLQEQVAGFADASLAMIYAGSRSAALWHGSPGANERKASLLALLHRRASYGLPADPDCERDSATPNDTAAQTAAADIHLTQCLLKLRADVSGGIATEADLGRAWALHAEVLPLDAADVADIIAGQNESVVSRAEPPFAAYRALRQAYRDYADQTADWSSIADATNEVRTDGSDDRLPGVRQRLQAEGYLSNDDLSQASLMDAIRRYQARNGLEVDGRLGVRTMAALNVAREQRIVQIAVNLERWRHVPRQREPSYVEVNVANATLELVQDNVRAAEMRAIIGDAKHQTPRFRANIGAVTFNPPWTIPNSIAAREILPKIKRDRRYLQDNSIQILNRPADPFGAEIDWRGVSRSHFPFELRQDPGSKNPLGLIKFEMANPYDVYIHDTPAKSLFALPRRGLSHGCIRVQDPETLARLLLPGLTPVEIQNALASGKTETLRLTHPLPVYVLYWTAFVDSSGVLNFRNDYYGLDAAISAALHLGTPPRLARAAVQGLDIACT